MNPLNQITFRLTRTLGIAATVVGLLFLSSSDCSHEESPQEAETVEVEWTLTCRKNEPAKKTDDSSPDYSTNQTRHAIQSPLSNALITSTNERDRMNGIGAYLFI